MSDYLIAYDLLHLHYNSIRYILPYWKLNQLLFTHKPCQNLQDDVN